MSDLKIEDKLIKPEEESNVTNPSEINTIANEAQTSS